MTTALIADDEPQLALYLQSLLATAWPELEVLRIARNGIEAARGVAELQPDIAFLDIRMPGLSGLEVAQGIEGDTRVVFVTAYDEFAVQAFEQQAIDYVLKPVKAERLAKTVGRLRAVFAAPSADASAAGPGGEAGGEDARLAEALKRLLPAGTAAGAPIPRLRWVRASNGDLMHQIDIDDVLFFRADDKYTCVHTAQGEHLIRTPIVELAAQLDPEAFWQVHRSTLINLRHMAGTRRDETSRLFVRMRDYPQELPVSRAYVHLFKAM